MGSTPISVKRCALIMLDSSKWLGGLPLTQRIAGSSPLSSTSGPYRGDNTMTGENGDRGINQTVRPRCGADRTTTTP